MDDLNYQKNIHHFTSQKSLTNSDYANLWEKESNLINSKGVYKNLANLLPNGNVLEIGCGNGNGTLALSRKNRVLSLEVNQFCIDKTKRLVENTGNIEIYKCDFLKLKKTDKNKILEFSPQIIVGWFLGANGCLMLEHTKDEDNFLKKAKLYREKLEDAIISPSVCLSSTNIIHLANRGLKVDSVSDNETEKSIKHDYDTYVFERIGFEVVQINFFDWDSEESKFPYIASENSFLADKKKTSRITSIIANRKV